MKKLRLLLLGLSLIFSSCALFENDVADFMEKYTETAAIEQHSFNVETYNNASNQLCIASDADAEITLLMRNPKQFSLIPSVEFNNLASTYNRSAIAIDQEDSFTVKLSLPQEFLIPVDEGKDITALINLHEPMSGRDFDRYTVNLSCNSKPPAILNPTILNKSNQIFVIAFDMPNEEEVAIRHKDLASVEINGVSYPVQVTTETDSTSDPEHPDLQVARYTFTDPHFKRSYNSNYYAIGGKNFEHNANNSVYFESDDTFSNGDKEYTIILRDKAGLTSEVKASTSISKLQKPVILDKDGVPIAEGALTAAPYDETTERGTITIVPPTQDHNLQPVSGTTVHYKVYEATGSGRIYTSGTTTTTKTIELPQNTYRVEAYATLTNYENSATNTVKFRFMNSVIYVEAVTDLLADNASNLTTGDGSIAAPFPTIADVIADINANRTGNDRKPKYTIYIKGNFTSTTYGMQDPTAPQDYGSILLEDNIETDELIFKKWQGASEAKLKSINIAATSTLQKVTIGDITVTNSGGEGITHSSSNTLIIDGTTITGFAHAGFAHAIQQNAGYLTIKNCNISNTNIGLYVNECTRCDVQGGVFESNNSNAIYYYNVSGTCTISGGTIKNSISTGGPGIVIENSTCTISGVTITNCDAGGIGLTGTSTLNLSGGTITGNKPFGINVNSDSTLKIHGNPKVTGNTVSDGTSLANVIIGQGESIIIDGTLTSGARMGITTHSDDEPADIGTTYTFANGYANSGSPSQFFTSDRGFSIVAGAVGAVNIAKSGSSGGMGNAFDYAMTFAFENEGGATITRFNPGEVTPLYIRPTITSNGTPVTYASIKDSISWTIKLYNGGTFVQNLSVAENGTERIKVNLPSSLVGSYIVEVSANLLSLSHPGSCSLQCVDPNASTEPELPENAIGRLTEAPTSGTYSLSTFNELKQIRDWVNGTGHPTLENVTIELEADIDTGGEQITISRYNSSGTKYAFKGTLDGKGHKITNTINTTSYANMYDALISYLDGGTVKNLTVTGTSNCNSLVGYCKNSTIENCISETNITIAANEAWITSYYYLGGIVGYVEGNSVIKNCINKGNITINKGSSVKVGGIVGIISASNGEIDRCINKGNITSADSVNIYGAGGIVGFACYYKYIRNSKNIGTISCKNRDVGGITGGPLNNGSNASTSSYMLYNCCNLGDVNTSISGNYGSSLFSDIDKKPNLQNNCSACNAKNGLSASIPSTGQFELTSVEWILNNYCMEGSFEDGKLLGDYPNSTDSVKFADTNVKAFSSAEVDDVIQSLNDWVSTHNTTPGTYATWKKNAAGKPELDLGELDNQ